MSATLLCRYSISLETPCQLESATIQRHALAQLLRALGAAVEGDPTILETFPNELRLAWTEYGNARRIVACLIREEVEP